MDQFGGYTAQLEVFDASNNSLGVITCSGTSTSNGDNSASLCGLSSTVPFTKVVISGLTASQDPNDFAINRVSLQLGGPVIGTE